MLMAAVSKFARWELWHGMFSGWGYPAWFLVAIGVLEIAGALALLWPKTASYAATLLGAIMTGALVTVLTHASRMGPTTPSVYLVLLAIIGVARWPARMAVGGASRHGRANGD
jgi:uncharacterized membrane protein YphA (DoxX/SURF4 family)